MELRVMDSQVVQLAALHLGYKYSLNAEIVHKKCEHSYYI